MASHDEKVGIKPSIVLAILTVHYQNLNTTQPVPVPQMAVPTPGNRNVLNLPLDAEGKRPWSFGLLSCLGDINKCSFSSSC